MIQILAASLNYKNAEIINGLVEHHTSIVPPSQPVPCVDSCGIITAVAVDAIELKEKMAHKSIQ